MKAASINDIKKELRTRDVDSLRELCLRLGKYKKENKELLTYLLYEAEDEHAYVQNVKNEIDEQFSQLPFSNLYYLKKSLRKTLRITNRLIRFSGIKESELEIRIHFCTLIKKSGIRLDKSPQLSNLYQQQVKKINGIVKKLPEDLQFDYQRPMQQLN